MELAYILIGLCVGSFTNLATYRVPKKQSILKPRSYCNKCKKNIRWYDNFPVISWIILLGKCRYCSYNIPFTYPIIEIFSGILYAINLYSYNNNLTNLNIFSLSIFTTILMIVALIDFENMIIPNDLIMVGFISGLSFNFISGLSISILIALQNLGFSALSGFLGFILLEIITFLISLVIGKSAFGAGDSKFMIVIGSWLGFKSMLLSFLLAIYIGGFASLILLILKVVQKGQKIPFGPYLSIGSYLVCIVGQDFWIDILKKIHMVNFYI
tara:strand:+ start:15609 stop:16418 length:810 start_codon:yes stop_codon:yes gene_type:complete